MSSRIFLFATLALFFALPLASASTMTRSLPDSASPGETVEVTLGVDVSGGETYYLIDESVPEGWAVTDPGSGDSTDPGHVKWAVIQGAASTSYTYEVEAPESEGAYTFSGKYMFEGMTAEAQIGGQQSLDVRIAPISKPGYETLVVPAIILGSLVISTVFFRSRTPKPAPEQPARPARKAAKRK